MNYPKDLETLAMLAGFCSIRTLIFTKPTCILFEAANNARTNEAITNEPNLDCIFLPNQRQKARQLN